MLKFYSWNERVFVQLEIFFFRDWVNFVLLLWWGLRIIWNQEQIKFIYVTIWVPKVQNYVLKVNGKKPSATLIPHNISSHDCLCMMHMLFSSGAMWKLHIHPLRSVTSGQSVCLWCHNDGWYQRVDPANLPAGAPAYTASGEAGESTQQCSCSVKVRHEPDCSGHFHLLTPNTTISYYT